MLSEDDRSLRSCEKIGNTRDDRSLTVTAPKELHPGVSSLGLDEHEFVTEMGGLLSKACFTVVPLSLLLVL